jgi:hypothetical protein
MAWGARKEEDGSWRLCERRGRSILHVSRKLRPPIEIRFPGRAMAEDCAHKLNELYWPAYHKVRSKDETAPVPCAWEMLDIILEHKGITPADMVIIKEKWSND